MGRMTIRTEPLDYAVYLQVLEFCKADFRSVKSFFDKYITAISYQTFQAAMRGELISDETTEAINTALDVANWESIRRDRKTCPHCKAALD